MEQYPIKSVTFGGFDKQDVINYIEKLSQEAAEAQAQLQKKAEDLQDQLTAASEKLEDALSELESSQEEREHLRGENKRLQSSLARESSARQELSREAERLRPLEAEVERLAPDAQAYAQFRERIGAIECEARKRADDLEAAAAAQLRQTLEQFQTQYQSLLTTFKNTAVHVTGELRKIEVNLTQLPRAMDPATGALNALSARLNPPPAAPAEPPAERP